MPASETLTKAIVATAELMGNELTLEAGRIMCNDLAEYPEDRVLFALQRCRREVRGRLTLAEVVARIDDGRIGPEEAWAMMPRSESQSVVWTQEMSEAFFKSLPLLESGDEVAARMTFKETYTRLITDARATKRTVAWTVSIGHDKSQLEQVLKDAVQRGRLTMQQAQIALPNHTFDALPAPAETLRLIHEKAAKRLPEPTTTHAEEEKNT